MFGYSIDIQLKSQVTLIALIKRASDNAGKKCDTHRCRKKSQKLTEDASCSGAGNNKRQVERLEAGSAAIRCEKGKVE